VNAVGISINRWEPWNGVRAVRSGKVDAVQVIYNIFDQNPEDELFPACEEMNVAVIARVPFDEGTLTGTITKDTTFPADDWRSHYFAPENLIPSVERADAIRPLIPEGSTMAEMALRFILSSKAVSTIIPGMRKIRNVESNIAASDSGPLSGDLLSELRKHRWVRKPAPWSD
jgi:aryl-alcohol dehydrogenase-like predicted oxidoreductase